MTQPMSFDDPRPDGAPRYPATPPPSGPKPPGLLIAGVGAVLGTIFSAVSSSDFIAMLDRQVHTIHCSLIPGAGAEIGESGCRTVMLSPYSSIFRDSLWGGIPLAILAVAVFAYLVMHIGRTWMSNKPFTKNESFYLVVATLLPVFMSALMAFIALSKIGELCKVCEGIYASSAILFVGAFMAHSKAAPATEQRPMNVYARWFGEGVLYVVVLVVFYVMFAPSSEKSATGCGTLVKKDDAGIMIPLGRGHGTPAIAVVDPLCPACKGFDARMRASDLYEKLSIEAVLFPLDATCNWMVKESLHPGACAVSEAMLCDKDGAEEILDYAFANQEELRDMAKQDDAKIRSRLESKFPKLKGCLGTPKIKNQVNKSLKWAVSNAIPVLTPQLFIGDKRVCDEDTDLGLEYTVDRMLTGGGESHSSRRR
jgi:uncharacterized membrane protein